jgi:DNA recombination protein RmuC
MLELALIASLLVAVVLLVLLLRRGGSSGLDPSVVEALRDLARLQTQMGGVSQGQQGLTQELSAIRAEVRAVRAEMDGRRRLEDEMHTSTRRMEALLTGSASRGLAGEAILAEAFRLLPAGMIDYNFKVGGKPVEFALRLHNGKRLPIDSKWAAGDELVRMGEETDEARREQLRSIVERWVQKKAREAAKYIDPAVTVDFAIAAVPDAAYGACRTAHAEAFAERVILMPYSMAVPYVLTLYNLYLQHARSIDLETLDYALTEIDRQTVELERLLDNSVQRGATMIQNAYQDARRSTAAIRGAIVQVRGLPAGEAAAAGDGPGPAVPGPAVPDGEEGGR